ncbi:MAG: class I SAM-dependent DNA methyltransferase [Phycisphaerae bacterium]|nr:class I SAM-dependent DNA methyltransferase [Phycisphaerae bacterium]
MPSELTPAQFVVKWSRVSLTERAASQEHFIDLCRMLGQPTPAEHDATGAEYTFEKGVTVTDAASRGSSGQHGFADAWWRGKFAWEYKRKGKYRDLTDAYRQLCQYREALENPPLLVVSDIGRTEIHTNFTGTKKEVHVVELEQLAERESLDLLRRVFTDAESFRPEVTTERVTEAVAKDIGHLALELRGRGHDPHDTAHFLMKCMFCLFAEDIRLLPESLFQRLLMSCKDRPDQLRDRLTELFRQMRTGGSFGVEDIPYFDGGLFDDDAGALELNDHEIAVLLTAARQDWGSVEPAIFGTLFERSLDPNTRAQIGAHYTSREDILLVVEPVVMAPLRREWDEVRRKVQEQLDRRALGKTKATRTKADTTIADALLAFVHRLATVRILDPACGSGNFLYVAIQQLLDLEKEVITYAARPDIGVGLFPQVRPTQLHGIEINPYAAELAQVVIWIGYLQWMRDNGFAAPRDPILQPLQTIENRDAILAWEDEAGEALLTHHDGAECKGAAAWPEADFIIGNPPFLGTSLIWERLGTAYREALWGSYTLPNTSDYCCYWFERARLMGQMSRRLRVGLLATQGIRGASNRAVLQRIRSDSDIFMAWGDRPWVLDGAAVHVSIVGFSGTPASTKTLDGREVASINPDLTACADLTAAVHLRENQGFSYIGTQKNGPFDVTWEQAREMLKDAGNPNGRPNSDVVHPWVNGVDLTARSRSVWLLDFGSRMSLDTAAGYETPLEYVRLHVKPLRDGIKRRIRRERWWLLGETMPAMRDALAGVPHYIATPRVSKHRVYLRLASVVIPDCQVVVFTRSDDYFLGVLHSSIHELWARRMGTQLREAESGFRYTPTTCFETFPLPWAPGSEPQGDPIHKRISEAARDLNEQRERWLNPPEWIDPIAEQIDAEDDFADVPQEARPLIRQSAIMARAAKDDRLKKRTLTNLYNQRPTWLKLGHEALDRAVLAAYAQVDAEGEWAEDWAEVWVDSGAGQPLAEDHALAAKRQEIDQRVLANLLRMNLGRAGAQG